MAVGVNPLALPLMVGQGDHHAVGAGGPRVLHARDIYTLCLRLVAALGPAAPEQIELAVGHLQQVGMHPFFSDKNCCSVANRAALRKTGNAF